VNSSADVGEAALALAQARYSAQDFRGARDAASRATSVLTIALGAEHSRTHAAQELTRQARSRLAKP
jgi:hypothetical protein